MKKIKIISGGLRAMVYDKHNQLFADNHQ